MMAYIDMQPEYPYFRLDLEKVSGRCRASQVSRTKPRKLGGDGLFGQQIHSVD